MFAAQAGVLVDWLPGIQQFGAVGNRSVRLLYHSFARVLATPGFDCLSPASFRKTLSSGLTVFRTDTDAVSLRKLLLLLLRAVVIITFSSEGE